MQTDPIVIVGAARTPMGALLGSLSSQTAYQLGAVAIKAAMSRAGISGDDVQAGLMGCVLPAGQGQAPARHAMLDAGIPMSAGATTINKMCGSGMQAAMLAHDAILAGTHDILIAGGMESMSNAPYLLSKARSGYRLGHGQLTDHMFLDGLEDAYDKGKLMGCFADITAEKYNFSRQAQDEFAITSLQRAQQATEDGTFAKEIQSVTVKTRKATGEVSVDEVPGKAKPEKIPQLKPAFAKDGTVTAANSSSIADGAAALVLMRRSTAEKRGLQPLATIVAHVCHAQEPNWFTTAPIAAIEKLYAKTGWTKAEVDLYEINEAFAVVTMVAIQELQLSPEKVNIHGGACALGHPIGASGARLIVTLLNALEKHNLRRGIAALCIGGGEATAIGIER